VKHFIDSVVSFSFAPIRFLSVLGLLFALAGFGYALVVIGLRLLGYVAAGTGFAALMVILLVSQGLMMIMLGVMGEYIWRTLDEARRRPRFIVEERFHPADRPDREALTVAPRANGFPHN
jgi:dolichol-phosphate mannosyltransferase